MTSIRSRLLDAPRGFEFFQRLVGAHESKRQFITEQVRPKSGHRILDLGCGTGALLELLPPTISYVGVDIDRGYIERARRRLGDVGTFVCGDVTTFDPQSEFDIVMAYGVLHHLDDSSVQAVCALAARVLTSAGRAVFADPCRVDDQSRLEIELMKRDRGRHIRAVAAYVELLRTSFSLVNARVVTDSYRIPYTFVFTDASSDRAAPLHTPSSETLPGLSQ